MDLVLPYGCTRGRSAEALIMKEWFSPPTMVAGIGPPPFVLVPSMPGQG